MGSHWVIKIGNKRHCHNYEDLCRDILGPTGRYLHSAYSFVFAFTSCIAYVVIIGQTSGDVSEGLGATGFFANKRVYIVMCAVFIMLPLSCLRDMVSLENTDKD